MLFLLATYVLPSVLGTPSGVLGPAVVTHAPPRDSAHLVVGYQTFRKVDDNVVERSDPVPALLVTTEHWLRLDVVTDQRAFVLTDLKSGASPVRLELMDVGGVNVPTDMEGPAYGWFLLKAAPGEVLQSDGMYELTIRYDVVPSWDEAEDANGDPIPKRSTASIAVKLDVSRLAAGEHIGNYGDVTPATASKSREEAATSKSGVKALLSGISVELTPETAEGSDELALGYRVGYEVDRRRFGASYPGTLALDLAFEGRITSDRDSPSITGYSRGELSLRAMFLLGRERYYPAGLRLAGGYEGGDQLSDAEATGTAQAVATLPYFGDLLEAWQELLEFERAFAPPYVSFGYVGSGATVGTDDQDRLEFEAGWILPVAQSWDLNARWHHFDFTHGGIPEESLLEVDLTYYPGGDLKQGVRLSFEEGYRAAVGDIGSAVLVGYAVRF